MIDLIFGENGRDGGDEGHRRIINTPCPMPNA